MLVGVLRRLRAPRVDHDQPAAAAAQGAQPAGHVGRGEQRAVADVGVGAEHQQPGGAVDVRHGQVPAGAEEQRAAHLLGHLVHRGRGVEARRAQRGEEGAQVEHQREAVRRRVAGVHRHRAAPVLGDDPSQPLLHRGEGLVPGHLDVAAVAPQQRPAQPVGVVVEVGQAHPFGTDEAVAEDVVLVTAEAQASAGVAGHGQPAGRLAERADHRRLGHWRLLANRCPRRCASACPARNCPGGQSTTR